MKVNLAVIILSVSLALSPLEEYGDSPEETSENDNTEASLKNKIKNSLSLKKTPNCTVIHSVLTILTLYELISRKTHIFFLLFRLVYIVLL